MENQLRIALLEWLRSAPYPINTLNLIDERGTSRSTLPWLELVSSASTEWGTKDRQGREVRVALELNTRDDDPATATALVATIEARVASLPSQQGGLRVVSNRFLRARTERRTNNIRATLMEFRFRLLAAT
ncbi:tail completion protein gp17 [Parerythrobacter jejuensis]|uniref:DUF3168 domain-containing protein n=1 Tax=Parerythrobacter jejuensis TaxID=795812 RepID=A0A845AMR4_9SPHN|nr:DUF3168 domain-containing protein [Parerythrobacter jejuensis]MXP30759.1 DUF3168 domain-containing protein [Parerythrobacter jejuensis]MXP33519.1 DUF3168 domain-containing protein [Parerythrobacter jejuensis]